jgi:hypothetical protein
MSLRERIVLVNVLVFVGGFAAIAFAASFRSPLPLLVWLFLAGTAELLITRCPTCGKSVYFTERRRTMGFSIGYTRMRAERICSRCATRLLEDNDHT